MSNIQQQIKEAEMNAINEFNAAAEFLVKRREDANKKSRDIFSSAQKDADAAFASKKELLEIKLEDKKKRSSIDLAQKIKNSNDKKSDLIKKGVSFLLTRLIK